MNRTVQCKSCLSKLIEELEALLRDVPRSEEGQMYREAIVDLQELIQSKQLIATEELLKVQEPQCIFACVCSFINVRWTVSVFSFLRTLMRALTLRQATCRLWSKMKTSHCVYGPTSGRIQGQWEKI